MARTAVSTALAPVPAARDVLELLKPHTWFPPMWAFLCGVVASGANVGERWQFLLAGIVLTGPLVCGTSQAVNDWFDRHVDAINEPGRPIPSGRIAGNWGLRIALVGTGLGLLLGWAIGLWVFAATIVGLLCAWAYSAPPLRFKTSGWLGPSVVALSYEGLSWFTGTAVMLGALPGWEILALLALYSVGTHGIMTLNDFKAVEGDRETGLRSLPVTLGLRGAALWACGVMVVSQAAVLAVLWHAGETISLAIIAALLAAQFAMMPRLLGDPVAHARWYNIAGVPLFVLGMMAAALGVGGYW